MKNRQAWPILSGPWWSLQNLQFSRTRRKRSAKVEEQFEFRVEKNALFDEPMNQLLHWTAIHWGRVHQLTMTRKSIWGMSGLSAVPSLINTPSRKTGCVLDLFISGSLISMLFDVIWCYLMLFDVDVRGWGTAKTAANVRRSAGGLRLSARSSLVGRGSQIIILVAGNLSYRYTG